jgi:CHAD domain-containing protein
MKRNGRLLLDHIQKVLDSQAFKIDVLLDNFLAHPDDPETTHRLRVAIRTLRSSLSFITPFEKRSQNREIDKALRITVRQFSRLRELDVLCDLVATALPDSSALLAVCRDARHTECRRTATALKNHKLRSTLADALKSTRQMRWRRSIRHSGLFAEALQKHFGRLQQKFESSLDTIDISDSQATHTLRKDAKQLRYVADAFGDILGSDALATFERMSCMQDDLGTLCDDRVNQALLERFASRVLLPQAREELETLLYANQKAERSHRDCLRTQVPR